MDGTKMSSVLNTNLTWPNGIAVDDQTRQLYWADAFHDHLETADINGGNRRSIISNNLNNTLHSFDVHVENGYLYWSDWGKDQLFRSPIDAEVAEQVPAIEFSDRIFGFTLVDTSNPRLGGKEGGEERRGEERRGGRDGEGRGARGIGWGGEGF